jgi:peptide/nickel transport system ATP-binding protein
MQILNVRNLNISFGNNKPVVNNISFSLQRGETLGVVGESGSGKSLTGLAIMGLLPRGAKVTGEIILTLDTKNEAGESPKDSVNLLALSEKQLQKYRGSKTGFIFQEPMTALNPVMTCGKQVSEVLQLHTNLNEFERKARVLELFNEVLLPNPEELYLKYPHQLSGGQRQRVVIALAIACNPLLLIADEPTTALDVTVQLAILELLMGLKKKYNLSIIFVSHDLGVISKVSDKILVLCKGNQIEFGLAHDIMNNPKESYTKGLIACKPSSGKRLTRLPVISDFEIPLFNPFENNIVSSIDRELSHSFIYKDPPVLIIKNLNSYFAKGSALFTKKDTMFHALKNIDLSIWKGETVGLVGESGSGKSTLGRTIMHLIENFSGNIFYKEQDVSKMSKSELLQFRKKVQLVFQDPFSSLNPNQTIGNALLEPMLVHNLYENYKQRKQRVIELMSLTGLEQSWFDRFPHQLSGGQRQRVVIARALALEPEVLICDESVSALDVSIQAQILNLLNDLKIKLGLTYLFISHDMVVVKYMADRILVMNKGEIIEQAEADTLCNMPKEAYTKKLLNAAFLQ